MDETTNSPQTVATPYKTAATLRYILMHLVQV
jgi:hypothetical protein